LTAVTVPAQNLFVPNFGSGNIQEFTNNGVTLSSNAVLFASGLANPNGLAFDSAGNMYVADSTAKKVYQFSPSGQQSTFYSGPQSFSGIAFDHVGNLYGCNGGSGSSSHDGAIYEFINQGGTLSTNPVIFAGGLNYPQDLAFDSSGDLFVASLFEYSIHEFKNIGGTLSSNLLTFVSLNYPVGLTFDHQDNLFVGTYSGNIYEFTNNAGVLSSNLFVFSSGFSSPYGLVFDHAGNLFVSDESQNKIYEFTNNMGRLSSNPQLFASGLNGPAYLAFSPVLSSIDIKMFAGVIINRGQVGSTYKIQAAADLAGSNWVTLTNVTLPSLPYTFIDYNSPTNNQRFYRAQIQSP